MVGCGGWGAVCGEWGGVVVGWVGLCWDVLGFWLVGWYCVGYCGVVVGRAGVVVGCGRVAMVGGRSSGV